MARYSPLAARLLISLNSSTTLSLVSLVTVRYTVFPDWVAIWMTG